MSGIFLGFLGLLLALPKAPPMKPSRLAKSLPLVVGDWEGNPKEVGEAEKKVLAGDTEFERMEYQHWRGDVPPIEASIVFSGKDMSASIHRPQVCLRAQGWEFMMEGNRVFKEVLPGGKDLPVREMVCRMPDMQKEGEKWVPRLREDGSILYHWRVFFYTYFGHEVIVSGQYERTFQDMEDRLLRGFDQRWAYATFSMMVTEEYVKQGMSMGGYQSMNLAESRKQVGLFLRKLLPMVVAEPGEGVDEMLTKANN